jgi:hypothetical protein
MFRMGGKYDSAVSSVKLPNQLSCGHSIGDSVQVKTNQFVVAGAAVATARC